MGSPRTTATTGRRKTSGHRGDRAASRAWRARGRSGGGNGRLRGVVGLGAEGDRAGAAAALSDQLIDRSAICCRPGELGGRIAWYEEAGATTLLAMPFGDRPRILEELAGV